MVIVIRSESTRLTNYQIFHLTKARKLYGNIKRQNICSTLSDGTQPLNGERSDHTSEMSYTIFRKKSGREAEP